MNKRKKNLARALAAFAAYLDVPGVRLVVTPRRIVMAQPARVRCRKAARAA